MAIKVGINGFGRIGRNIMRATLGSGDFFGEVALLTTGRRTASVTTTKPTKLLVLFGSDFTRLRTRHPAVAAEIEAAMERRLRRS